MAKIHQNAQGKGGNQRQQAAGYRYGGSAVPIEILNDPSFFPLGPGGVKPDPTLAMPDFAGPWGAGSKPVAAKTGGGGGGGSDGGGEKGKRQTDKGTLRHVGGAGSGKENFAGKPAPTPKTQFSPDLAPSPNPYQMGSPVDPRPTAAPGVFQGPPQPAPGFSPDLAPSPNPFQPGSPVDPSQAANPFQGPPQPDPWTAIMSSPDRGMLAKLLMQAAQQGQAPAASAAPDTGVPGAPAVGSSPPVVKMPWLGT